MRRRRSAAIRAERAIDDHPQAPTIGTGFRNAIDDRYPQSSLQRVHGVRVGQGACGEAYEWTGISTLIAFPDIANSFPSVERLTGG